MPSKLEERVLLLMKKELEESDNPTELMKTVVDEIIEIEGLDLQTSALEDGGVEMEQSVSIVQQLSSGNFPNTKSKRQRLEEYSSDDNPDEEFQHQSPPPEKSPRIHTNAAEPVTTQKRKRIDDETEYPVLCQLLSRQCRNSV
eukprot:g2386.t1